MEWRHAVILPLDHVSERPSRYAVIAYCMGGLQDAFESVAWQPQPKSSRRVDRLSIILVDVRITYMCIGTVWL